MKKNYKVFFPVGITFAGAGVAFMASVNSGLGFAFIGLGIVFMVIGGKHIWRKK